MWKMKNEHGGENHGLRRKQNAKSALRLYAFRLIELPQVRFATQIITRLYKARAHKKSDLTPQGTPGNALNL